MKFPFLLFSAAVLLFSTPLAHPGSAVAATSAEQHRIDMLIEAVDKQSDLVFIRNGSEHNAEEAANHLRRKMRRAGNRISTAEEFIDHLATGSSLSGKPYMIRQPGKEPEPAGIFLHRLLREVAPKAS